MTKIKRVPNPDGRPRLTPEQEENRANVRFEATTTPFKKDQLSELIRVAMKDNKFKSKADVLLYTMYKIWGEK